MHKIAYTFNGLIGGFNNGKKSSNAVEIDDYNYESLLTLKYCSKLVCQLKTKKSTSLYAVIYLLINLDIYSKIKIESSSVD